MSKPISKSKIANRTGGVETDDGRTLYGFDAECYNKVKFRIKIFFQATFSFHVELPIG